MSEHLRREVPRVLSIAGTDPTGGAGMHADLKTIAVLGGYGMAAVTAIVAQNTCGVRSIHTPPPQVLRDQLEAVSDDVVVDAVKIGMLGSPDTVETVGQWLGEHRPPLTVIDPVMVATAGGSLLDTEALEPVLELLRAADLVTPNLTELARLVGSEPASSWPSALEQGRRLSDALGTRVLVKGGHLPGESTPDALLAPGRQQAEAAFDGQRIPTGNTHGTGCSLSSAIAVLAARTGDLPRAVGAAREWLRGALLHADELEVGAGSGPVHHGHHLAPALAALRLRDQHDDAPGPSFLPPGPAVP